MTTQLPPSHLPVPMQPYGRALENSVAITQGAQDNTSSIIRSMRQSVASNYGLGGTLTNNAGNLSDKVFSSLRNVQSTPLTGTLQRTWQNYGSPLSITSAPFASNVALSVSGASQIDIFGGDTGAIYQMWHRVVISGGVSATRMISVVNYGQTLFYWNSVPANTGITLQLQLWGYIKNPDGTFTTGNLLGTSVVRLSAALRSIALV